MSSSLIAVIAVIISALIQGGMLVAIIIMVRRDAAESREHFEQVHGVAAATYLQGRRLEDVLKELRESLNPQARS